METWKTNLDETKKRYIDWWNHKGIILNMWEHFQEEKTVACIPTGTIFILSQILKHQIMAINVYHIK